ncbi:MAG TPA: hypothetical protein VHC70_04740, partial [Phycisphaerales bacterium]|nr:hypothetical protein [Phycisphaerales bacterium]
NDDSTGQAVTCPSTLSSRIASVALTAGQTYYIGVAGYNGARGAYTLNINYTGSVGSCCVGSACTLTDALNCAGTYADGGSCSPSPCGSSGVCCRGSTCSTAIATAGDCAASLNGALAGAFFASSASCNAGGSTTTPCCYPDYNKMNGVGVPDIFDFLNDWFAGRLFANVGGDGSSGSLSVQNIFDFLNAWFAGGC